MADYAIEAIARSVDALKRSDVELAKNVIVHDNALDALEKAGFGLTGKKLKALQSEYEKTYC